MQYYTKTRVGIVFDEDSYLSHNQDVAEALKRGQWKSGLEHFLRHGFAEGRNPLPLNGHTALAEQEPDRLSAGAIRLNSLAEM